MLSYNDSDFGVIEFTRSKRATRIRVRIMPDKLCVSLPLKATEKEALKFIDSVRKEIQRKQDALKQKAGTSRNQLNENTELNTLTFAVQLRRAERDNIFFSFKDGKLSIEFPAKINCKEQTFQEQCWRGINYFLRKEAKRVLPGRTQTLADKYDFRFSSVKIQSSKSRWGSCSGAKNINFSFYLMLLPQHLVDYVILHELCHTKEMNHSEHFWALMDKVTGNQSKNLRRELKKYHMPAF